MSPAELLRAVSAALAADGPASRYVELAGDVESLTDMIGWAGGPIDPTGRFDEQLEALQLQLHTRYEVAADAAIAFLHNALGSLREAVVSHDEDLAGHTPGEDEDG